MEKKHSMTIKKDWFINKKPGRIEDYYYITNTPLAIGKFSTLYLCRLKDPAVQEIRVIKKILKKNLKTNIQEGFKNEIQILQKLDHPHIVKLYQSFQDSQCIYLVIQYCQGGQLIQRIINQSFDQNQVKNIFRQIILAINYCHMQHVVHRDLKIQNFLYVSKEKNSPIKLIDFGLSMKFSQTQNSQKKINKTLRVSNYVAPQVFTGKYTQTCDIWSAGIILYFIICGFPPFENQNQIDILEQVKRIKYRLQIPQLQQVSPQLKNLLNKMLSQASIRPTASQILQDQWFKTNKNSQKITKLNVKHLKSYATLSKIKKIAITMIATQLEEKNIIQLSNLFKQIDKNNDGVLSYQQLKLAFSKQKQFITNYQIQKVIQSIDSDHNGTINYTQFISSCLQIACIKKIQNIRKAFRIADYNNDGVITRSQLKDLLKREDYNINEKSLDQIMKECDYNNDGKIDFEQFLEMINKIEIK